MPVTDLNHLISVDRLESAVTTDDEYSAADAAHLAEENPHGQYAIRFPEASNSLLGPITFPTTEWTSLGPIDGLSLGTLGKPSCIKIGLCFLFDERYPWQQAVGGRDLWLIWWQPINTNDPGERIYCEHHNGSQLSLNLRGSQGLIDNPAYNMGVNRRLEMKPTESPISIPAGGRLDIYYTKTF